MTMNNDSRNGRTNGRHEVEDEPHDPHHLLHVDGWDFETDEMLGSGRCVGTYDGLHAAVAARTRFCPAAEEIWGHGHLVITDATHHLLFAPLEMFGDDEALALEAAGRWGDAPP